MARKIPLSRYRNIGIVAHVDADGVADGFLKRATFLSGNIFTHFGQLSSAQVDGQVV